METNIMETIKIAIQSNSSIIFHYPSKSKNDETRHVEPYGVFLYKDDYYLYSWDYLRNDIRTFKINKINNVVLGNQFVERTMGILPDMFVGEPFYCNEVLMKDGGTIVSMSPKNSERLEKALAVKNLLIHNTNILDSSFVNTGINIVGVIWEVSQTGCLRGKINYTSSPLESKYKHYVNVHVNVYDENGVMIGTTHNSIHYDMFQGTIEIRIPYFVDFAKIVKALVFFQGDGH